MTIPAALFCLTGFITLLALLITGFIRHSRNADDESDYIRRMIDLGGHVPEDRSRGLLRGDEER